MRAGYALGPKGYVGAEGLELAMLRKRDDPAVPQRPVVTQNLAALAVRQIDPLGACTSSNANRSMTITWQPRCTALPETSPPDRPAPHPVTGENAS